MLRQVFYFKYYEVGDECMNKFTIEKNIERVIKGKNSNFLNPIDCSHIINNLCKFGYNYHVFLLFEEAEKLVIYKDKLLISLFEIKADVNFTHKQILGALFSHNLNDDVFGDIIIMENKQYIVVLNDIKKYMMLHFDKIGKNKVKLIEREISTVADYHLEFKNVSINVTSFRIDNIISKLINVSRKVSVDLIKKDMVLINYSLLKNSNYILKENDIFSIRGEGKFKFIGVTQVTRTGKYSILINKYK